MKRRKKTSAAMERQKLGNPRQTTFGSMMDGVQWEEKILSTADLFSGQLYQRPVKERVVDKLVREWDPRLLTPLVVSYRDGRYNLVDGQHRVCGGKKKNSGKDVDMLCQVYYGLTYEQEAELYYKLDQAKGHLRLSSATKALLESGSNAEIVDVQRRIEEAGFVWALDKPTGEPFEITATRAVISAYHLLGGAGFSRMLGLIAQAWRGAPGSLKAAMFSGMALFLKTYETELDDAAFIKRLSTVDADEIIRRGKVDFNKAALRFARVIWDKYNGQRAWGPQAALSLQGLIHHLYCRRLIIGLRQQHFKEVLNIDTVTRNEAVSNVTEPEKGYRLSIGRNIIRVVSVFNGTKTASEAIHEAAVKKILFDRTAG